MMAESGSVHRRKTNGHNVTAQLFSSFFLRLLISPFHHHTHTQASCCNRSRYSRKKKCTCGRNSVHLVLQPLQKKKRGKSILHVIGFVHMYLTCLVGEPCASWTWKTMSNVSAGAAAGASGTGVFFCSGYQQRTSIVYKM